MLWNAKCLVRAMLGTNSFQQVNNLLYLTNVRKYFNDYRRVKKVLLKCSNGFYVTEEDVKDLRKVESSLQRNHMTYLLRTDPELLEL